jgi:hypothetical protein
MITGSLNCLCLNVGEHTEHAVQLLGSWLTARFLSDCFGDIAQTLTVMMMAFEPTLEVVELSINRGRTPFRRSERARIRPVGPAPHCTRARKSIIETDYGKVRHTISTGAVVVCSA